jgi:NDP-sugar pyrophosphorylase family protein
MQAMIFAAGKGTRLKPLTDVIPKALVPVGDVPLIQRVMQKIVDGGATRIVVNIHHHAPQLENYLSLLQLKYPSVEILISDESRELLDTGGSIKQARRLFNEPVLIHNCDILSNVNLREFYSQAKGDATLLVSERKTQRYLCFDDDMRLVGWTNIATGEVKGTRTDRLYAFSGIHVMSPSLMERMDTYPDVFPIMDFYLRECATADIRGYLKTDLDLLDVGKTDTLEKATEFLCKK